MMKRANIFDMAARHLLFGVAGLCARTFCACLCARALFAPAATVTPAAATNYLFTTPNRPAHIRGVVMGTPPAYYSPRSEDFDWLNEALQERLSYQGGTSPNSTSNTALVAEFGKWALSETNRFYRWTTAVDAAGVTNVVVGFNLVTNSPTSNGSPDATIGGGDWLIGESAATLWNPTGGFPSDATSSTYLQRFLDPDVGLLEGARVCNGSEVWTNVYELVTFTNGWTNAFSTISMPMTNGTVSVYTNSWTHLVRLPSENVYTNVIESSVLYPAIHFCHTGGGPFPGYTNAPPIGYATSFAVVSVISNDYAALRGAVRLADRFEKAGNGPAFTVSSYTERGESYTNDLYESYADITPVSWSHSGVTTNEITVGTYLWGSYSFQREHPTWMNSVSYKDAGTVKTVEVPEYEIDNYDNNAHAGTALLETRFPSDLATAGGAARVAIEAVYYGAGFSYAKLSISNGVTVAGVSTNVVLRLAGEVLDVSGAKATVQVAIDARVLCAAVAAAAGAPALPSSLDGDPGAGMSEKWEVYPKGFVAVFRITPQSQITTWQGENQ